VPPLAQIIEPPAPRSTGHDLGDQAVAAR